MFQALYCNCIGSSKKLNEQGWKKKMKIVVVVVYNFELLFKSQIVYSSEL